MNGTGNGGRGSGGQSGAEPGMNGTADRLALVEEHVASENRHDLDGIMATFGETPEYDDRPWRDRRNGREGVRSYYEELVRALPDLRIDVERRHATDEHVVLEVVISGTHTGTWKGLPGTGRRVEFPLCAVYSFDDEGLLAGERIYYDRATVLDQIGLFHDPLGGLGRFLAPLTHPLTLARVLWRRLLAG